MERSQDVRVSQALGWFSVGLGLAELAAPRAIARSLGAADGTALLRLAGAREVLSGAGLLAAPDARAWRWARVAGDVLDLAMLGVLARQDGADRGKLGRASLAVLGVTAVDVGAALASRPAPEKGPPRAFVTIGKSPDECYRAWNDLALLRRAMSFTDSIEALDRKRTRWTSGKLQWEAETTEDVPGRRIAWRTLPGGDVEGSGAVEFREAPGGRGCVVTLEMRMSKPRPLAEAKAKTDLLRFKQLLETGTIATTAGQSAGARSPMARLVEKAERR